MCGSCVWVMWFLSPGFYALITLPYTGNPMSPKATALTSDIALFIDEVEMTGHVSLSNCHQLGVLGMFLFNSEGLSSLVMPYWM